jgi:hypothetical protein
VEGLSLSFGRRRKTAAREILQRRGRGEEKAEYYVSEYLFFYFKERRGKTLFTIFYSVISPLCMYRNGTAVHAFRWKYRLFF